MSCRFDLDKGMGDKKGSAFISFSSHPDHAIKAKSKPIRMTKRTVSIWNAPAPFHDERRFR